MAWEAPDSIGDLDPAIAAAKEVLDNYEYGRGVGSGPLYTLEFGVVLTEFQDRRNLQILKGIVRNMPGMPVRGRLDWATKKNLGILPRNANPASPNVPVVVSISGHMGGMFDGPHYFTARALEHPIRRVDVQPVGAPYDNRVIPFNNASGMRAADAIVNDPREIPFGVDWAFVSHSQGSIVACDWWEQIIKPNRDRWPYSHFRGGVNFGNPRRPMGVVDGSVADPPPAGSEGLDPDCLDEPIPGVIEIARDGDFYTNKTPGRASDYMEAVYLAVARGKLTGANSLLTEMSVLGKQFGNPAELLAVFWAITRGVVGVAQLREHGEFDLREPIAHLARILRV